MFAYEFRHDKGTITIAHQFVDPARTVAATTLMIDRDSLQYVGCWEIVYGAVLARQEHS